MCDLSYIDPLRIVRVFIRNLLYLGPDRRAFHSGVWTATCDAYPPIESDSIKNNYVSNYIIFLTNVCNYHLDGGMMPSGRDFPPEIVRNALRVIAENWAAEWEKRPMTPLPIVNNSNPSPHEIQRHNKILQQIAPFVGTRITESLRIDIPPQTRVFSPVPATLPASRYTTPDMEQLRQLRMRRFGGDA
jgi:hypothetical protein